MSKANKKKKNTHWLIRHRNETVAAPFVIAALIAACSPLAPSVSKLSSAPGPHGSTSATEAVSNASGKGSLEEMQSNRFDAAHLDGAKVSQATTHAVTTEGFHYNGLDTLRGSAPGFVLSPDSVADLSRQGLASFDFRGAPISGNEEALLSQSIVVVYLVFDLDQESVNRLNQSQKLVTQLTWSSQQGKRKTWNLALKSPALNGEDSKQVHDAITRKLKGVAVVFVPTNG